jgi:hypothetical protein
VSQQQSLPEILKAKAMDDPVWVIDQLRPLMHNFCEAKNWKERLPYVRDPERISPLMESYYKTHPDEAAPFRSVLPEIALDYRAGILSVNLEMEDYSTKSILFDLSGDHVSVDWESFVGYCEMDPEEFKNTRPTEPVTMRVSVSWPDVPYFNYRFKDEKNLYCFFLTFPDDSYVFAYVQRSSPEAKTLRESLRKNGKIGVVLRVAFPENAPSSNQVWIREVLEQGWVLREDANAVQGESK